MKKNIYGTTLEKCNNNNNEIFINDSSNKYGYCFEDSGGYHNICLKMKPIIKKQFSLLTGQDNWSSKIKHDNHCVCQGAWANYIAYLKKNNYNLPKNILNCEAIPEEVLTSYHNKFKSWNNVTIKNQEHDGYSELVKQCPKIKKYRNKF